MDYASKNRLFIELKLKNNEPVENYVNVLYKGDVVGLFQLGDKSLAFVTRENTINKDIVKACIYDKTGKRFCARFKKLGFGIDRAKELVTRYCIDEMIGVL